MKTTIVEPIQAYVDELIADNADIAITVRKDKIKYVVGAETDSVLLRSEFYKLLDCVPLYSEVLKKNPAFVIGTCLGFNTCTIDTIDNQQWFYEGKFFCTAMEMLHIIIYTQVALSVLDASREITVIETKLSDILQHAVEEQENTSKEAKN